MIVWVKYGFESTPLKMYNMNVSSAVLLSFLKATCVKDIDDFCKQKNIQLSVELDAIRRAMPHRKSMSSNSVATPAMPTAPGSRPSSRSTSTASAQLEDTHQLTAHSVGQSTNAVGSAEGQSEEAVTAKAKKEQLEKQLEAINAAAKLVKELVAGVAWVDLVDQSGTRMGLDTVGNARVDTILTARQQYSAVSVTKTEFGDTTVTPLVFKLSS